jgi:hypothetical protein
MCRTLIVRDNVLYVTPRAKDRIFPEGAESMKLGGQYVVASRDAEPEYVPPAKGEERRPIIENNRIVVSREVGRRPANHVDVVKLSQLVRARGEEAALRPESPAKDLRAQVAGPGAVKLTWEPSDSPEVVGYRAYYGSSPNSYAHSHVVTGRTTAVIKDLKPGGWWFSVAAHKEAFVECWQLSNEAAATIQ